MSELKENSFDNSQNVNNYKNNNNNININKNNNNNNNNLNNNNNNEEKEIIKTYETRKKKIDFNNIGDRLSLTDHTCHICKLLVNIKNIKKCDNLKFKEKNKKKKCGKDFCINCLKNYFPNYINNINNLDWKCPCCKNECNCTACKNSKKKVLNILSDQKNNNNNNEITLIENNMNNNNNYNNNNNNNYNFNNIINNNNNNKDDMNNIIKEKFDIKSFNWEKIIIKILGKFNKDKNYICIPLPKKDIIDSKNILNYKKYREELQLELEQYKKDNFN